MRITIKRRNMRNRSSINKNIISTLRETKRNIEVEVVLEIKLMIGLKLLIVQQSIIMKAMRTMKMKK